MFVARKIPLRYLCGLPGTRYAHTASTLHRQVSREKATNTTVCGSLRGLRSCVCQLCARLQHMMMVAETQSVPGPSSYSMLLIHVFATTMTTSNYLPTFALEIVQDLHQPAHMVAWLYATMTFSSIVGMALMPRWLERFETRFILTTLSTLRFSSGLLHVIAISVASFPFQMPLLFGRLFLHGISLGTTVVANTWIAIRVPPTEVPRAIAMVTAASTLGVAFGPLLGNLFAAVEPSLSADDAAAGWSTATTSLMLMLITALYFEKGNLVKTSPSVVEGENEHTGLPPTILAVLLFACFLNSMGTLGLESIVPLFLFDYYKLDGGGSMPLYLILALSSLAATFVSRTFGSPSQLSDLATAGLALSLIGLGQVNWFNLTQGVTLTNLLMSVAAQAVSVTIVITSVISAMTLRTVPHRQAKLQAGVGMVVQIGRAVGPIFATELYEAGNYLINGSGGNIALAFGSIETIVGCLLPVLFAKHLFDFDPSGGKNEKGLGNTFEL